MIVYQGRHETHQLPAGHRLTVVADAASSGNIVQAGAADTAVAASETVVKGPYATVQYFDIFATVGFVTYSEAPSLVDADGTVGSASLADDICHTKTVALTSAQILALSATPIELVAAPGAGKIILLESIVVEMTRTATGYANGGVLETRYENSSGALASATFPASLVTGGAGVAVAINIGLATILTPLVNKALVILNATAPFITGTGTGRVLIKYRVVTAG
jgi:hypothetical protein